MGHLQRLDFELSELIKILSSGVISSKKVMSRVKLNGIFINRVLKKIYAKQTREKVNNSKV